MKNCGPSDNEMLLSNKKKELCSHEKTRGNLRCTSPSERNQSERPSLRLFNQGESHLDCTPKTNTKY